MSDKQPLVGAPTAPPPPYQPSAAGYGAPPPQAAAPSYGYGGAHHHTNVIVTQARPVENRVFVEIKPSNYVVLSIITMLFFCWIFGLIGLIVGMQVDSAWLSGDHDGARRHSNSARMWNIVGIVVGVILYVLVVVAVVVANVVSANAYNNNPYNY